MCYLSKVNIIPLRGHLNPHRQAEDISGRTETLCKKSLAPVWRHALSAFLCEGISACACVCLEVCSESVHREPLGHSWPRSLLGFILLSAVNCYFYYTPDLLQL